MNLTMKINLVTYFAVKFTQSEDLCGNGNVMVQNERPIIV